MSPRFIAEPPRSIKPGSLTKHLSQMFLRVRLIVWQILAPFHSRPEEIDPFPEPTAEVTDSHVEQCQWMFDQAEKRRLHLEQKAQSTFGLMVFLVPLLASLFVFIISRASATGPMWLKVAIIALLIVSTGLLLLGFISAVRAVSVKAFETLFLDSVIDKNGQFREYKRAFRARGLLYCAAMNEAMNDHLAQFVKGAHFLTAAAVSALVIAAVPTSFMFSNLTASPTQTKIVGPMDVPSPELIAIRNDVANVKGDIGKLLSNSQAAIDDLKRLEEKFTKLDARLNKIEKAMGNSSARK
jgi:hypothetical protein